MVFKLHSLARISLALTYTKEYRYNQMTNDVFKLQTLHNKAKLWRLTVKRSIKLCAKSLVHCKWQVIFGIDAPFSLGLKNFLKSAHSANIARIAKQCKLLTLRSTRGNNAIIIILYCHSVHSVLD